jgi:hypothetical protein
MTEYDKSQAPFPDDLRERIYITAPGRGGGLREFIHVVASILVRLDAEQQVGVQSASRENDASQQKG